MNAILEKISAPSDTAGSYQVKDFKSDQEVRWCPGCGDYAILAQMQKLMPELGVAREKLVFISGIGCSSRFPYYMNAYGFHTIHGRAPAIASGLKIARPDLSVWVITGDGDSLSIGGNHLIHLMRRNVDVNVLLFNNEIYGLTKGQYSPTSNVGLVTKSTPFGSLDHPFNPLALSMGADATFVARTMDRDLKHLQSMLRRSAEHRGTSFLEIYQNCIVFNDGVFGEFTDKESRPETSLYLEHGRPMIFGAERDKGIRLDGLQPVIVSLADGSVSADDLLVHDETDATLAFILASMGSTPGMPRPFGVLKCIDRQRYDVQVNEQIHDTIARKGRGDLDALLHSGSTWIVE